MLPAGFEPAILRVKGGRDNHSTTGMRHVCMALSAESISLMAGYEVVFEGQEKASSGGNSGFSERGCSAGSSERFQKKYLPVLVECEPR